MIPPGIAVPKTIQDAAFEHGCITGFYADHHHGTLVHVKVRGKHRPVCGANVDALQFQWCAMRVEPAWVECRSCRRILGLPPKRGYA